MRIPSVSMQNEKKAMLYYVRIKDNFFMKRGFLLILVENG